VFCLDAHHANVSGEFLGGCVWFETLFARDVRENPFVPAGMPDRDAVFLKDVAHAVC
jgi:hypothetical protein